MKTLLYSAAALAIASSAASAQTVTRGPYLQSETPSSIIVRWRTSAATDSRVLFGAAPSSLTQSAVSAASVTDHVVQLSGLLANTQYYYSIGSTTAVLAGGDANHFFRTAPSPGTQKPTHIWVLGDSGTADNNARAVRDSYFARNGSTYTDLLLMLGDNAYNSGTDAEYQAAIFNMYPTILRQTVVWATLGNHDGISADSLTQSGPYYDIFSFTKNGEAGGLPSGTEAYFSFEYGNIHFINLESFETDRSVNGAMMNWLRSDLAQNTKQWTIAFWHHPPYTKGSHDSDTESELVQMRQNALPILEAAGVDLVLSGHSHSYERSFLIDGHYGLANTFTSSMKKDGGNGRPAGTGAYVKASAGMAPHEGAVYAVAGSSGQTGGGSLNHPAMFISLNTLGSMVLDVNGGTLDAIFLDSTGATRDSFRMVKGGPPPSPTALTSTAVSGSLINLAWTDKSTNEDGFAVQQSTDNVTFTPVITLGPNVTSYAVTGLAPATLYFFRVIATNSTYGNSSPSNTSSATTSGSSAPTLTSVSPAAGSQGSGVPVTFTGTNFAAGASIAVSGTGVTASNVVFVNSTQITATLNIAAGATVGSRNVSVSTAAGTSGSQSFSVNAGTPPPSLSSITPSSGTQGATVNVALAGTNFASGATLAVSGSGVTASNVVVVSATQITATLTTTPAAATGARNVTVTTSGGISGPVVFTVAAASGVPTLTSISPSSGTQGSSVPVTLTGTNFTPGSSIRLSGLGGSHGNSAVVVDATTITATFTFTSTAALGAHNVSVVTSAGTTNTLPFTVNAASGAPVLSSISPSTGTQGSTVNVTLTGQNFVSGSSVSVGGSGVTASNVAVPGATQITATLTIAAGAAAGAHNVSVTTSSGSSGSVPFTVNAAGPVLSSISPASGTQGNSVNVTLNGNNFLAGASVGVSGTGVTASNVVVVSASQITATLAIAAGAATGSYNVTVTTSAGTSGVVPFTVGAAPPVLTSISPASGAQGSSVNVTLNGSNFLAGSAMIVGGSGVTASNVVVVTGNQITATLVIAAGATTGSHSVAVTTSAGTSGVVPFTVGAAPPVLTSISPASGAQGSSVNVTLNGSNFLAGSAMIVGGSGVTASNVVVVTGNQITATLVIAAGATTGSHSVAVTTSAGTSGSVPFTVSGAPPVLTSISPASGTPGTSVNVTLNGSNFLPGAAVNVGGSGVTASNIVFVNPTQVTATLNIAAGTPGGGHNVTVTTSSGTSATQAFSVNAGSPPPVLSAISPTSAHQGDVVNVTLTGANFTAPATINFVGSAISVTNVVVVNQSTITAVFHISATAALRARDATVTTAAGSSNSVPFTVN